MRWKFWPFGCVYGNPSCPICREVDRKMLWVIAPAILAGFVAGILR